MAGTGGQNGLEPAQLGSAVQSQVCREGGGTSLASSLCLQPCTPRAVSSSAQASSVLLPLLSPIFCFNQADSNKLQAITRKTLQSVLGNAFHCLTLSYSINYVKLLLPAGTKGVGYCACEPCNCGYIRGTSMEDIKIF